MNKNNQIPNKNIRTGILIIILIILISSAIYIAITGKNNNFDANRTREEYEDHYYDDYYDDYDYDEDYNEDYDYDDYDDYDDNTEKELSITSQEVKNIYDYIKEYPYIPGLKSDFTTTNLTKEEKMKLVIASMHSKEKNLTEPLSSPSQEEITIDSRSYKAHVPYQKFYEYEVTNMYYEIFGTSDDIDNTIVMKYGYDTVYKYDETAYGYVEYIAVESTATNTLPNATLKKAIKKGKKLDLYIEIGSQTEKYSFEKTTDYGNYKFTGRTTTQKNSL